MKGEELITKIDLLDKEFDARCEMALSLIEIQAKIIGDGEKAISLLDKLICFLNDINRMYEKHIKSLKRIKGLILSDRKPALKCDIKTLDCLSVQKTPLFFENGNTLLKNKLKNLNEEENIWEIKEMLQGFLFISCDQNRDKRRFEEFTSYYKDSEFLGKSNRVSILYNNLVRFFKIIIQKR